MKLSILEIIGDSSLGGAPRHFLSILENIDLDKYELHAITPAGPLAGEIKSLSRRIDLDIIAMPSRLNTRAIKKIRHEIRHIKPDIIHIHGTRAGLLGRLASIGTNIPVIYTEHLWTEDYHLSSRILNFFHYSANWFLDIFTTENIAVSNAVRDFMINAHITYAEKIKVIYNGIDITKHQADIFNGKKEIKIATVGTLNENKGMQFLIKAMPSIVKEFPEVHLEIIGDGAYKKTLQNLTHKLEMQKFVKFSGFIPDVQQYLSHFDLYVQPSLSESFGLAILQAMSVGLPVVATNTGGIPEVVTVDKSGKLVNPRSSKELSDAILNLLRNQDTAKKLGHFASREAKLRFNLKDMIIALETTYDETHKNPAFSE